MADEGRRSLVARFGAARAVPTRLEVQHLKATVRARLFGIHDDLTRVGEFTVRTRIGSGGMGAVYEAIDPGGEIVAIKTLRGYTPAMLYQLKHEFRALAGVVHPNLVGLHKLYVSAEQAFFSMERVHGHNFVAHVRGDLERGVFTPAADLRLRSALAQLVDGVVALHGAGKLHRDLKPSNVLVTAEGRVVVLDFGLVRDIDEAPGVTSSNESFAGTPAYMAPELASGSAHGEAGDWYAIGVMLHEALCGALPFEGPGFQVLLDKCRNEVADARDLADGVPDDLAELALALLDRDPGRRPDAPTIRGALGGAIVERRPSTATPSPGPCLGREAELEALEACVLATARDARPTLAAVHGAPGMGVSALLQAFCERVTRGRPTLCVQGRCYAQEAVPFRAIDPLIDDLTRALLELDEATLAAVVPADV
ncbi:MAG: serine/threonine-protein kinase, partial [Nannocystaceae bacterium]